MRFIITWNTLVEEIIAHMERYTSLILHGTFHYFYIRVIHWSLSETASYLYLYTTKNPDIHRHCVWL